MATLKGTEFHTMFDDKRLRGVFAQFPSGLAAICASVDGAPDGFVVASFQVGISLDPPLVSFAVMRESRTWTRLRGAPRLGVSVLAASQSAIVRQLASKTRDRFDGVAHEVLDGGAIVLDGSPVTFNTSLEHEYDAGDHAMILLRIHGLDIEDDVAPLIFHRSSFHALSPLDFSETS
jgi:flavin reductase (DIM6/NTAB) family NADH-FMN oxidoreductase RutF